MPTHASAQSAALALGLSLALLGHPAQALPPSPPALPAKEAKALALKLNSADASIVLEALAAATAAGPAGAPVTPSIEAILARGSTAPITKAAIEALGAIGARSSSAAIRPYLQHRVPALRRAAARALARTRGPEALAAYKEALRHADAEVRSLAAEGLGDLGPSAREALPELFLALDRQVNEAAAAIGKVCAGDECDMLVTRLGKEPLPLMTSGLDAILFRAPPLPDAELVRIIGQIRALPSKEASQYLAGAQARWPASGSAIVKQALEP